MSLSRPIGTMTLALLVASTVTAPLVAQVSSEDSGSRSETLIAQAGLGTLSDPQSIQILSGPDFAASVPSDRIRSAILEGLVGLQVAGNTAVVQQEGTANIARVVQIGRMHVAAVGQVGSHNRIEVLQDGVGNLFGAWLDGSDNILGIEQRGMHNEYFIQFAGQALDHRVVQEGTGLRAVQIGTGALPFEIHQRGNGAAVRIEHNGPNR